MFNLDWSFSIYDLGSHCMLGLLWFTTSIWSLYDFVKTFEKLGIPLWTPRIPSPSKLGHMFRFLERQHHYVDEYISI